MQKLETSNMKKIISKNIIWISIILTLLLIGSYFAYDAFWLPTTETSDAPSIQTAVARLGDMTIFTSGAGEIIPATRLELGFQESGTLIELHVNVGSEVKAGQVIARLQTNNSEASIASSIASAELSVLTAEQNLDQLYASWELTAALALQDIAVAENNVEIAQIALNRSKLTANQLTIDTEYADLILARNSLENAQKNFDRYADKPEDNLDRANAQTKLSTAQYNYDVAIANYNAAVGTADELDILLAEADLGVAQANLATAQQSWEEVKDAPNANEVSLAKAQLTNAEAQLALALEKQVFIDLVAPIGGTILSIDASVGENVSSGAIITLADLQQPLLEIFVDETDLDKVAVGYEAEIIFDALPNELYSGHVIEVNPSLVTISNVNTVNALVELDDFSKPQTLPVGLNASVEIIGGRAIEAVIIPVEALRELSPDEYAVFVMENGEPKLRVVTVGLVDFTSAEILTGLEPGDIITTGIVETNN
jgi:HlyD family secretion protein